MLISAGLIILSQTGCGAADSFPGIQAAQDTDLILGCGGAEYKCHIGYVSKDTASLTFLSPEPLSGMSFRRTDSGNVIALGSLLCKGAGGSLLSGSAAFKVFGVYDRINENEPAVREKLENGNFRFSDDTEAPTYVIETDPDGIPKRIDIPDSMENRCK